MHYPVVVVGSFIQDLTWRCADFPRAGETVLGEFVTGPGGKGSNQAVAAARAGAGTAFIGAVGADVFAAGARAFYEQEGIGARFIEKPGHATGTAGIIVNAAGQNEIIVALGASAHLAAADLDNILLADAKVVVCQHEANLEINREVFRRARATGATTVLNPAPMRPDFEREILALVDILVPNETEFLALARLIPAAASILEASAGDTSRADAEGNLGHAFCHAVARGFGVPTVIITLGARGCLVSSDTGYTVIPAYRGIQVVDTTGAGDAFVGGFAAGLLARRGDVLAAAAHGNAVAALSVTKFGTAPSMPTQAEIERFVARTGSVPWNASGLI